MNTIQVLVYAFGSVVMLAPVIGMIVSVKLLLLDYKKTDTCCQTNVWISSW